MVGVNSLKEFMNLLLELSMKIEPSDARLSAFKSYQFLIGLIKVVPREYIARPYANKDELFVYILCY